MDENKPTDVEKKITGIHTLESDLAAAVNDQDYGRNIVKIVTDPSKNSLLQVENTPGEVIPAGPKTNFFTKKNILIAGIVIFILASGGVIASILYKAQNYTVDETLPATSSIPQATGTPDVVVRGSDLLNPEVIQSADFSKTNRGGIIEEINKIKNDLLDKKIAKANTIGINTNVTIQTLFQKINYSGDEALLRSFGDVYAFGLYTTKQGTFETYLLIQVSDFDQAFKSMLDWEKFIPVDLKDIFIGNNEMPSVATAVDEATTTSSTTPSIPAAKQYYKKNTNVFLDRVLKNYDIREYVKNEENTDIIYGFLNNKWLLITSGEESFIDAKDRLLKENILR